MVRILASAIYGLIAVAPKANRQAKWCTSQASPASTTRPTAPRLPVLIRWWWTADTASKEGMAACLESMARSESINT
ncbi:hypothetical protein D3C73_815820 [compost metagenome]